MVVLATGFNSAAWRTAYYIEKEFFDVLPTVLCQELEFSSSCSELCRFALIVHLDPTDEIFEIESTTFQAELRPSLDGAFGGSMRSLRLAR